MKAVILTGALRTIKKTMRYFKQNVLFSDVHVFACVQNDSNISNTEYEEWLYSELGDHLKSVEWFVPDLKWVHIRDGLLSHMNVSEHTINYLRNGGSMIEYYQLQRAYMKMAEYEKHGKYDYVIRARTDTIYAKPVDFHWLHWSEEDVAARIETIKTQMILSNMEVKDEKIINYFMNTILSDDIIPNISNIECTVIKNRDTFDISSLHDYIKNGSYLIALRKNLLYIVKRDLFYVIPCLGTMYGFMKYHGSDPNYWWNAENQFDAICYHANITLYQSSTLLDANSVCDYHEKRYFDSDYNIINPYITYCLVRN